MHGICESKHVCWNKYLHSNGRVVESFCSKESSYGINPVVDTVRRPKPKLGFQFKRSIIYRARFSWCHRTMFMTLLEAGWSLQTFLVKWPHRAILSPHITLHVQYYYHKLFLQWYLTRILYNYVRYSSIMRWCYLCQQTVTSQWRSRAFTLHYNKDHAAPWLAAEKVRADQNAVQGISFV